MKLTLSDKIAAGTATLLDFEGERPERVYEIKSSLPYQLRARSGLVLRTKNEATRTVDFWSSPEVVDRMGDIVRIKERKAKGGVVQGGMDMTEFERDGSPVLWQHNGFGFTTHTGGLPIGRVVKWTKAQKFVVPAAPGAPSRKVDALRETFEYHEEDLSPFAEVVFRMVMKDALPAVSIGFIGVDVHVPETPEEREKLGLGVWGVEFRSSKKVETSNVIIPANPMATQAKSGEFEGRMLRSLDDLVTGGQISDSLRRKFVEECSVGPQDALMSIRSRVRGFVDMAAVFREDTSDDPESEAMERLYAPEEAAEYYARMDELAQAAPEVPEDPETEAVEPDEDEDGEIPELDQRATDVRTIILRGEDGEQIPLTVLASDLARLRSQSTEALGVEIADLMHRAAEEEAPTFHVEHSDGRVDVTVAFHGSQEDRDTIERAICEAPDLYEMVLRETVDRLIAEGPDAREFPSIASIRVDRETYEALQRGFEEVSSLQEHVARMLEDIEEVQAAPETDPGQAPADLSSLSVQELVRRLMATENSNGGAGEGGSNCEPSEPQASGQAEVTTPLSLSRELLEGADIGQSRGSSDGEERIHHEVGDHQGA